MINPYLPPDDNQRRVFKSSLVGSLAVVMVVAIYAGYVYFYATSEETGFFAYLKAISFEVFLLCEVGIFLLIIYNKKQLDNFLYEFPIIENRDSLNRLKPIVRTNMYSSLFMFLFLAVISISAIMSILNNGILKGILVAALSIATTKLIKWYNPSEEKIKQIKCTDEVIETELNNILQCWVHKPFPDF